jgi:serine protease AprX
VIEGLEWTIAHKEALGIRVVVLALSAPARASYRDDLLAAATEIAWHSGLVVVVAGGNGGPAAGSIASPAYDPLLLTVGAVDERGTRTTADDVIPAWSSQGPTVDGVAKPDLVAPGRKIVSVRVQGSTLDRLLPLHVETAQTFRLSGTSQAAAVSAGAAAVLLQQRDRLEPDEVKAILTHSTTHLNGATPGAAGAGEIDVARALATPVPPHAKQSVRPGNALLHLLEVVAPGVFEDVLDDHAKWDAAKWDAAKWDAAKWDAAKWDAAKWDAAKWDAAKWDAAKWDAAKWDTLALD